MLESLRELQAVLKNLAHRVRKNRGAQIQSATTRGEAMQIVDMYFRTCRSTLRHLGIVDDHLERCDRLFQSLLEASHHQSSVSLYRTILKELGVELIELEKRGLLAGASPWLKSVHETDLAILGTLRAILPSAACSYEQAIVDLQQGQRFSWRGPATDLRESLRETLDHLAPDKDVTSEKGFKLEADLQRPTMKQKVCFILRKRGMKKSGLDTSAQAAEAVENTVGGFVRSVYTRSSVSTHTPTDKREVIRIRDWVRAALCELLEIG
jgi:hypothetical protein